MSRSKPKPAPAETTESLSAEERVTVWLKANSTLVLVGTGVLALVVLITWGIAVAGARKEAAARAQLEQAWNAQDQGNLPLAASELQRVVSSFGGTDAAFEARLSLNQTRLLNGQTQLAVDDLTEFLRGSPPPRFVPTGQMLLGAGLEDLGRHPDAAAAYRAAWEAADQDYLKADALLAASRAQLAAGDRDAAVASLRTILESYGETAAAPIAEVRLGELTRGG